jgi:hypothetical protein
MAKFLRKNARIGSGSCTCLGTLAHVINNNQSYHQGAKVRQANFICFCERWYFWQ